MSPGSLSIDMRRIDRTWLSCLPWFPFSYQPKSSEEPPAKLAQNFYLVPTIKCILAANFIVTIDFEGSRLRSLVHPYPRQTDEILDNLKAGTSDLLTSGKFFASLAAALRLSYSFFPRPASSQSTHSS